MHRLSQYTLVFGLAASVAACQGTKKSDEKPDPTAQPAGQPSKPAPAASTGPGAARHVRNAVEPPMDISQPPADALKSPSGMPYKVLVKGSGDRPGVNDTVLVHYTGWRTTGQMFFTTNGRKTPQIMSLVQVSKGWQEAVGDMQVGEKRIVWMPPALATRGTPGKDMRDLVFQIELVEIRPAPEAPADLSQPPGDAVKSGSGLVYKVIEPGKGGEKPRVGDQVTANYTVWTPDGRMLDSTTIRQQPHTMQLHRESKAWQEALMNMVPGQKNRVWIPGPMVNRRWTQSAPNGTVVDFELVKVKKMPQPPKTPKDVAAPPKNAQKTENGVFYKVLKPGKGKQHPTADDTVKVHYTGWTTDGNMFDSSITRGQPTQFPLRGVIAGWTEGVQKMVPGETTRFWIPEQLAYKGRPGKPKGMLVFDIQLIEIVKRQ